MACCRQSSHNSVSLHMLLLLLLLKVMFSKPLPEFSCRLNALATALTCQWLMGPCKVNDVELDDGSVSCRVEGSGSAQSVPGLRV